LGGELEELVDITLGVELECRTYQDGSRMVTTTSILMCHHPPPPREARSVCRNHLSRLVQPPNDKCCQMINAKSQSFLLPNVKLPNNQLPNHPPRLRVASGTVEQHAPQNLHRSKCVAALADCKIVLPRRPRLRASKNEQLRLRRWETREVMRGESG
jgi:hypothetical protein